MQITMTPTPEMDDMRINGVSVPVRIWKGTTAGGVELEVLVLSIIPKDKSDVDRLRAELPDFMVPSRKVYEIDGRPKSLMQNATDAIERHKASLRDSRERFASQFKGKAISHD